MGWCRGHWPCRTSSNTRVQINHASSQRQVGSIATYGLVSLVSTLIAKGLLEGPGVVAVPCQEVSLPMMLVTDEQ